MLKSMTVRATLIAVAWSISISAHAMADSPKKVEIPAGDLRPALLQLSRTFGVELFYQPSQLDHFHTAGVKGSYTPEAAVRLLLKGTPLELRIDPSGAMMVIDPKAPRAAAVSALSEQPSPPPTSDNSPPGSRLQLAQATVGQGSSAASVEQKSESSSQQPPIQEVIVTAQKRQESLLSVPVPVTAIDAETLIAGNQTRLEDYYADVPGLSLSSQGLGDMHLTIRGVSTTAYANPTVGITIDDVPYGATTGLATNDQGYAPDLDPADLTRIEVLRGPQGTLYGASSIGGLIKFVTKDPSTDGVTGHVQADLSDVYNGVDLGYGLRGAVNVPVGDEFAVRASAFTRRDPGYVDVPALNERGVNEVKADGGRLSALWRASDAVSLKLSALYQTTTADGSSGVNIQPGLGDLQQIQVVRGATGYKSDVGLFSATMLANLGAVDLTSITAYGIDKTNSRNDLSMTLGSFVGAPFNVSGAVAVTDTDTKKFSQEFRLTGHIGKPLDWLVGVFYTHEDSPAELDLLAFDTGTSEQAGVFGTDKFPTIYQEYALFGDLTWRVTDRFDIQFGGRESENRQIYNETIAGPEVPSFFPTFPDPLVNPTIHTKDDSFTYLVTPRLSVSPDLMVYGRLASGYQPGGPNSDSILFNAPTTYKPSKTRNYEVGVKGTLLSHLLSFDASVYYLDWSDIQLPVFDPITSFGYTTNGSAAKSQGAELSVEMRPVTGLSISAWGAWNEAVLTANLPTNPSIVAASGDHLPYSPHFSGRLAIEQQFRLFQKANAFIGASVNYVGERESEFSGSVQQPRLQLPAYVETDLRAGLRYESWTLTIFANNIADQRGVLYVAPNGPNQYLQNVIQPRTIGASFSKTF